HQPQPRRTSRAEQQEINLHQTPPKRKPTPNKHHKTIENKPKHRRVENTQKTTTNHHNHQHKTKNNPKNKQKTIKNTKPGSVAQSNRAK
ncbi:hypothetical protein, partial [Gardnerella vaginalis]|uniref:hypothetical protein n=5 Tax=Gardnerella vaginalis TaxID=2702 RepID=UPI0006C43B17